MTIKAARLPAWRAAFARKSATSMLPAASQRTGITFIPAIAALAGLVPCADCGIRHTLRHASPRLAWYSRIEGLPGGTGDEMPKLLSQALVAMGQIAERQKDAKAAKGYYQHAIDLAGGDRGALESARKALQALH